jgi:hypothetical protein
MSENANQRIWVNLLQQAVLTIGKAERWHWFAYHFSKLPPHPMARSVIDAAADCERRIQGLGSQFVEEISRISGKEKHEPHYEQLLQKMSEMLVLRQLLSLEWPVGTVFQHEPAMSATGKRPELRVVTPERSFLFEVKTPSLLEHIRMRNRNALQTPGRALSRDRLQGIAGDGLTLPRDNVVKDFLLDADKKFGEFKAQHPDTSMLVIVWDDFIFEPITALVHERCGLLTPNSYLKDDAGAAHQFSNIDAVVLVRHLTYLYRATRDEPLEERDHALDFGDNRALPNVIIPLTDPALIPDIVRNGLRAIPWDSPMIQRAADYRPNDIVFWV